MQLPVFQADPYEAVRWKPVNLVFKFKKLRKITSAIACFLQHD